MSFHFVKRHWFQLNSLICYRNVMSNVLFHRRYEATIWNNKIMISSKDKFNLCFGILKFFVFQNIGTNIITFKSRKVNNSFLLLNLFYDVNIFLQCKTKPLTSWKEWYKGLLYCKRLYRWDKHDYYNYYKKQTHCLLLWLLR